MQCLLYFWLKEFIQLQFQKVFSFKNDQITIFSSPPNALCSSNESVWIKVLSMILSLTCVFFSLGSICKYRISVNEDISRPVKWISKWTTHGILVGHQNNILTLVIVSALRPFFSSLFLFSICYEWREEEALSPTHSVINFDDLVLSRQIEQMCKCTLS